MQRVQKFSPQRQQLYYKNKDNRGFLPSLFIPFVAENRMAMCRNNAQVRDKSATRQRWNSVRLQFGQGSAHRWIPHPILVSRSMVTKTFDCWCYCPHRQARNTSETGSWSLLWILIHSHWYFGRDPIENRCRPSLSAMHQWWYLIPWLYPFPKLCEALEYAEEDKWDLPEPFVHTFSNSRAWSRNEAVWSTTLVSVLKMFSFGKSAPSNRWYMFNQNLEHPSIGHSLMLLFIPTSAFEDWSLEEEHRWHRQTEDGRVDSWNHWHVPRRSSKTNNSDLWYWKRSREEMQDRC